MADLYDASILTGPDAIAGATIVPAGGGGGTHQISRTIEPIQVQQARTGLLSVDDILTVNGTDYRLSRIDYFIGDTTLYSRSADISYKSWLDTLVLHLSSVENPAAVQRLWVPLDGQTGGETIIKDQVVDSEIQSRTSFEWRYLTRNDDFQIDVTCFATGTLIETAEGPRPVHLLRVGDMVRTRDHGLQPLRWLGGRRLSAYDLAVNPKLNPIRITAGALGPGMPACDLTVSPQHRILVRSAIAERMTGSAEVLIAAVHLIGHPGIERVEAPEGIGYWPLMFDRHEIVFAEGAEAESLYLGPMAMASMTDDALEELRALFPDLVGEKRDEPPPTARPVMRRKPAAKLIERQVRNFKPLVSALA